LRDGISAVTNVDDSRTTIKQGNNIRVLTLITIAYLPLGFVTALFSASHGIIPDNAGTTLYAILTAVFVVTTYGLALSLEGISNFIHPRWAGFRARKQKGHSTNSASKAQEGIAIEIGKWSRLFGKRKSRVEIPNGFGTLGDVEAGEGGRVNSVLRNADAQPEN
jgi:hypothetical protein